jgi:hypothetical protein
MSKESVYFQAPLSVLDYGKKPEERLRATLHYCIMQRAEAFRVKHNLEQLLAIVADVATSDLPSGYKPNNTLHLAIVAARKMLNISNGDINTTIQTAAAVTRFVDGEVLKHGPSPTFRIRNDLLWDAIAGQMKYRDFSVLCALYAILGDKAFFPITRSRIIAGAMGYKSIKLMKPSVVKARADKAKPLTPKQVRLALDELVRRSLVFRVQANRRQVFYSNRMDRDTLEQRIIAAKVKKATQVPLMKIADTSIRAKIEAAIKTALSVASSEIGASITGATITETTQGPVEGHDRGHDRGHSGGHHNRNSLIESPLIESPLTQAGLKETVVIPLRGGTPPSLNQDAIESLKRKIQSAIEINTQASLIDADRFRLKLAKLEGVI